MIKIAYIADTFRQPTNFINSLISDLKKLGFKNIEHDRQRNSITVGNVEVIGISLYESCLSIKMQDIDYFIDGIDMKNYKNASEKELDNLVGHIKYIMMYFKRDTKQLDGKDELIKILIGD